MKPLKLIIGLFVTMVLFNSCTRFNGLYQMLYLTLKNNSEKSVYVWVIGEENPSSIKILEPGDTRVAKVKFEYDSEVELWGSVFFRVNAGSDMDKSNPGTYTSEFSISDRNDGKDLYRNMQFNSDGTFSYY